jgi:hypothetical protein
MTKSCTEDVVESVRACHLCSFSSGSCISLKYALNDCPSPAWNDSCCKISGRQASTIAARVHDGSLENFDWELYLHLLRSFQIFETEIRAAPRNVV